MKTHFYNFNDRSERRKHLEPLRLFLLNTIKDRNHLSSISCSVSTTRQFFTPCYKKQRKINQTYFIFASSPKLNHPNESQLFFYNPLSFRFDQPQKIFIKGKEIGGLFQWTFFSLVTLFLPFKL